MGIRHGKFGEHHRDGDYVPKTMNYFRTHLKNASKAQ